MKYPYIVNKNGVWYPAGAEVPEGAAPHNKESDQKQYTKTDINRMSTAELQALAADIGIENASADHHVREPLIPMWHCLILERRIAA